jgi:hypothetical protein
MNKVVKVYCGKDEEKNQKAAAEIEQVAGVEIEIIDGSFLEGRVVLPYIEVENRNRYYGLDSITKFVKRRLAQPISA